MRSLQSYKNWVWPSKLDLEKEYNIEWVKKRLSSSIGISFIDASDFVEKIKKHSMEKEFSEGEWNQVTGTTSYHDKNSLRNLLMTYRSWPKYRNDSTLNDIFDGFANNEKMDMPIILHLGNFKYQIMSGNTRGNVALILGFKPKCIVFNLNQYETSIS